MSEEQRTEAIRAKGNCIMRSIISYTPLRILLE
jgi:hypothetical protein